jgi:hypothetical protein
MAWPKGKPRPDAFKKKEWDSEEPRQMEPEEAEKVRETFRNAPIIMTPRLPISEKLSDVITELKAVLKSYRHDLEIKVVEQGNVTTSIEVKITFLVR